jgi:alpha-L-fucosidase
LDETYSLIHKLQPGTLIGSNHHISPIAGEDFQMFERDLPGENTMGFNQTGTISELPLEMCETMNGSWGFNLKDQQYKSSKQLIQTMVKSAGYGANFLLNTGPMPNGKIQPENIDTLAVMGKWLEKYGESIYNTRRGPIRPADWGATTVGKDGKIYLHVLEMKSENLMIPSLTKKIKSMTYFDGGTNVKFMETEFGLLLNIPKGKQNSTDTIIVVET